MASEDFALLLKKNKKEMVSNIRKNLVSAFFKSVVFVNKSKMWKSAYNEK